MIGGENNTCDRRDSYSIEPSSRPFVRRSLDLLPLKYITDMAIPPPENSRKRAEAESVCISGAGTGVREREFPKYRVTSVCGRRRDMEDAVSVCPSFCKERGLENQNEIHFFGVYNGHGCSHVATMCKESLHEIVKEEIGRDKKCFGVEIHDGAEFRLNGRGGTKLEPEQPDLNLQPDRPDELARIQDAGGHVIYWDGPRVLGVLAMSRAIGDNYLKPYVILEPEGDEKLPSPPGSPSSDVGGRWLRQGVLQRFRFADEVGVSEAQFGQCERRGGRFEERSTSTTTTTMEIN
ncbi:PPM-type phosphatase domain [Sesbania bispinosa]|nr:PPM-type phosphatase domain [Sesbania bispinosa]